MHKGFAVKSYRCQDQNADSSQLLLFFYCVFKRASVGKVIDGPLAGITEFPSYMDNMDVGEAAGCFPDASFLSFLSNFWGF